MEFWGRDVCGLATTCGESRRFGADALAGYAWTSVLVGIGVNRGHGLYREIPSGVLENASRKGETTIAQAQGGVFMTPAKENEHGEAPGLRTRLAVWNYASMLVFATATTLTGLIVTPHLVRLLGDNRFGAARVVVETAGYLTLLDLGLSGALSPLLARAMGRQDAKQLRATFASGMRLYFFVAFITVTVGLALTPWIVGVLRYDQALASDLRWAWVYAVLGFALLAFMPFRAMFDAEQRGFVYNLLCSLQALTIAGMSIWFASRNMGVTGQSLATLLGVTITMLILVVLGVRRRPETLQGLREPPDPKANASLRRLSGPTLLMNVASRVSLMTDGLLVGAIMGSKFVTILSLTQRLATMAQSQLQGIGGSAWAGLAELHARGERFTFNRSLIELTRMAAILGVSALGPIVAFNGSFLALWVGKARNGGDVVVLVAAINALLLSLLTLWGWCITGTGHAPRLVRMSLISAVINLGASVFFTYNLGVVGPLLGTTTAFVCVNTWYLPKLLREYFGTSLRELTLAAITPVALGAPMTLMLWYVAESLLPQPGWIALIFEMGVSAVVFLVIATRFLLRPADRALWRRRIIGALPQFHGQSLDPIDPVGSVGPVDPIDPK